VITVNADNSTEEGTSMQLRGVILGAIIIAGHGYRWTEAAGTGQYGESIG